MKYIPILYSTPMVKALMNYTKLETRRTNGLEKINEDPNRWEFVRLFDGYAKFWEKHNASKEIYFKCRYGQIGDRLWTRETFFDSEPFKTAPLFINSERFLYKTDDANIGCHKWKPNLHMPKNACRLFHQVTSITVERLHDITPRAAIREGILTGRSGLGIELYFDYENDCYIKSAVQSYFSLWRKINGVESYELNPWLWVVRFRWIRKPQDFLTN